MSTHIQILSREELDQWCSLPFNPPSVSSPDDETAFFDEYWACHTSVKDALEVMGRHDCMESGDFCTNSNAALSRVITIEFSSTRMMTPEFIDVAQRALRELPAEYELWISHECIELELFFLLVFRDSVRGHFRDPADAARFTTDKAPNLGG